MNKSFTKRLSDANRFFNSVRKNSSYHGASFYAEPSEYCGSDYVAVSFYCKDFSVGSLSSVRGKTGIYCYPSPFGLEVRIFVVF